MTKEILHKILKEGTSLDINAIPVEEKKGDANLFYGFCFFNFDILPSIFSKWIFGMGNCWYWKLHLWLGIGHLPLCMWEMGRKECHRLWCALWRDKHPCPCADRAPVEQVKKRGRIGGKYIHKDNPEKVLSTKEWRALTKEERDNYTKSEAAKGVVERVISYAKVWGERAKDKSQYLSQLHTDYYNSVGHKYGLARCQRIHFCVIPLAKKFVLSMIVCKFAASVLAKPLNNAQIVRGVFCLYTFEYGESYPLYKTVWIFR